MRFWARLVTEIVVIGLVSGNTLSQPHWSSPIVIDSLGGEGKLALDDSGNLYTAYWERDTNGTNMFVARSLDQGINWEKNFVPKFEAYGIPKGISVDHRGIVWILWTASDGGDFQPTYLNLSKSLDSGRTFSNVFRSIAYAGGYLNQKLGIDVNNDVFMLWDDQIFKLTKFVNGDTSKRVDAILPTNGYAVGNDPALSITKGFIIHCAWEGSYFDSLNNFFTYTFYSKSIDTGLTFGGRSRVDTTGQQNQPGLVVDSIGIIYVGHTGGAGSVPRIRVSRSTNGGMSFDAPVLISGIDTAYAGTRMCLDSRNGINIIWGAQGQGEHHYRSIDAGLSFSQFAPFQFGATDFKAGKDGQLYVVGYPPGGVGYAFSKTDVILLASETRSFPNLFKLFPTYPNPFNSSTTIRFSILQGDIIDVRVFDVMGRGVATLMSKRLAPGDYSVRWDADGLGSGVYFVRLTTGNKLADTKKMIFMK
jgi:hypothetical protein